MSSSFLRYFTAATLLLVIYRSIPLVLASFWPPLPPMPAPTPLTPPSTMDRVLDLIRPLVQYVGLLQAQVQPIRPPASPTRPASTNLVLATLKLIPWFTAEQHLITLVNVSMTASMLWKFLVATPSSRAVGHPPIHLNFHGLLFAAGGITLAITQHIGTRLSRATVELIEQSVGSANAVLALDMVASLPALVLKQNPRWSIVSTLALVLQPMLTPAPSPHLQPYLDLDWEPSTLWPSMPRISAETNTSSLRPLVSPSQRCIRKPRSFTWSFSSPFFK